LITIALAALLGFAALAIDVGNVYVQRAKIQEAADAAAIAAVRSWALARPAAEVITTAKAFAATNGLTETEIQAVDPGYWITNTRTFVGPLTSLPTPLPSGARAAVRVTARKTVTMFFAPVVGFAAMRPRIGSVAAAFVATTALRVIPWAVCDQNVISPVQCTPITLKYTQLYDGTNSCAVEAGSANFGALSLGGNNLGADAYKDQIINGYSKPLHVGDCIPTKPGNRAGPTFDSLDKRLKGVPPYTCTTSPPSDPPDNSRLAIAPRVDSLIQDGRSVVCITGFYVVALDAYDRKLGYVSARYLHDFDGTEVDPNTEPEAGRLSAIALVK
jgi:hypothetical protein